MAYDIKKDKNPMSLNILKLQRYNFSFFKLEEVIFFEYLVVKAQAFGFGQFYHSTATIEKETGIKRSKLESIIDKFINIGIIDVEIKGFPKVKHFTINFQKIQFYLPQIYQTAEKSKLSAEMTKLLGDFYNPFVEKYQKKNNKKETLKETLKEKPVGDTDWVAFGDTFNEFLFELKMEYNLKDNQLKHEADQLYLLYSNYPKDTILENLRRFFSKNSASAKTQDFLKTDPLSQKKNVFIEKSLAEEKAFAKKVSESLNQIFNDRRETNSTSKKKFTKTSLAINNSIIAKITEVLKVKGEQEIRNAFIAYSDAINNEEIQPAKVLPYFFSQNYGEYAVLDHYLDHFNVRYAQRSQ